MNKTRLNTRKRLRAIVDIDTFDALLSKVMLCDKVKDMLKLHYIHDKDFRFIGDSLGYSEGTIKRWHSEALDKLSQIL